MKSLKQIFGTSDPAPQPTPADRPEQACNWQLTVMGHSHLGALQKAWAAREEAGRTDGGCIAFARLARKQDDEDLEIVEGQLEVSEGVSRRFDFVLDRDRPDAVVAALLGNEYNSIAMVRHPEPFDLVPRTPGCDPSWAGIPENLMAAQMREQIRSHAMLLWENIAETATSPIYLVPPPPPIASEAHIRAHPGDFGALVRRHGLNPAALRHRIWKIYCEVLREEVSGHPGTTFVDLPAGAFEDGFLPEKFWQDDPTHGNAAYGEMLLTHLLERMQADGVLRVKETAP